MTSGRTAFLRSPNVQSWVGIGLTALLLFFSFPPVGHPFVAFIALVPAILASTQNPSFPNWRKAAFVCSWILWISLLIWLRHVYPPLGYIGLIFLTAYCALYLFSWLIFLRWVFPTTKGAGMGYRVVVLLGIAGAWGTLEWMRGNLLTGFGWLPLSASQESNPVLLSLCSWVGPYGLSVLLVMINLGLASWIIRMVRLARETHVTKPASTTDWLSRLTPELYLGLSPLLLGFVVFGNNIQSRMNYPTDSLSVGIVQTDFDPNAKWDSFRLENHLQKITELTKAVALPDSKGQRPDFILWPEAALPLTLNNYRYAEMLRELSQQIQTTLVIGTIDKRGEGYSNGVAVVTDRGIQSPVYAKRHLVPFGEYVPLASVLPLRKVVPIAEDCVAGINPALLTVANRQGQTFQGGALVCYEDVFPELAREHALAGADFLIVVTNDAWYGREAGAYQHAAHSALLAASTGLPVVRCGNAGWSGSINATGLSQAVTASGQPDDTIYFAGQRRVGPIIPKPKGLPHTPWVLYGDWAIGLGTALAALAIYRRRQLAV
jgi:apolipoprotein N-acyltransferase